MSKKQDIWNIILFILIGIMLFGIVGYKVYNDFFTEKDVEKKLISLDLYGYTLTNNDIELYKTNFKELEAILNADSINYEEYAKSIAKLFVIDVFTLDNKKGSTDIGGLEFVHKDLKENFKENLGQGMYRTVENNINGERNQILPIVESVEVTDIKTGKYTYKKNEYESYTISLKWKYTVSNKYQTSIKLVIIKDGTMLYIVKGE